MESVSKWATPSKFPEKAFVFGKELKEIVFLKEEEEEEGREQESVR